MKQYRKNHTGPQPAKNLLHFSTGHSHVNFKHAYDWGAKLFSHLYLIFGDGHNNTKLSGLLSQTKHYLALQTRRHTQV